mgnify:CR=1 FL=1
MSKPIATIRESSNMLIAFKGAIEIRAQLTVM